MDGQEQADKQTKLIARLRKSGLDGDQLKGLSRCSPSACGRKKCTAACHFGRRDRREAVLESASDLLENTQAPIYELIVPIGDIAQEEAA